MYPYGWILESWSCVLRPALAAGVVALDAQCSSFPFGPDTRRGSRTLSTLDSSNSPAGLQCICVYLRVRSMCVCLELELLLKRELTDALCSSRACGRGSFFLSFYLSSLCPLHWRSVPGISSISASVSVRYPSSCVRAYAWVASQP